MRERAALQLGAARTDQARRMAGESLAFLDQAIQRADAALTQFWEPADGATPSMDAFRCIGQLQALRDELAALAEQIEDAAPGS
jgi:hypothetical protein